MHSLVCIVERAAKREGWADQRVRSFAPSARDPRKIPQTMGVGDTPDQLQILIPMVQEDLKKYKGIFPKMLKESDVNASVPCGENTNVGSARCHRSACCAALILIRSVLSMKVSHPFW